MLRFDFKGARTAGALPLLSALLTALLLTGCDFLGLGGGTTVDVVKPVTIHPEADLFAANAARSFSVTEGIVRDGRDTTFTEGLLQITALGDTMVGGKTLKRVTLASSPARNAALTQLGLNPARLLYDTAALPDPGPGLRFPDSPYVSWSLDTTVGDLRHVRRLNKVETIKAAGLNQQCWVFTDSVYWNALPVAKETYWMGATGLVKHRREWAGYAPAGMTGGTLWREVKASN